MSNETLLEGSSSDKLDTLARKYFSSLIETSGQVYGSGELGTIPDMFPMLLMVVQEYLRNIDPLKRHPEINPGLTVTLEPMDKNKIGPSAFVSFTSKLRHGTFLVGSFSPLKFLNWAASRDLVKDISSEIDELFDDLQLALDPVEWRDNKYEIITNIIDERAQLINMALNSRGLHSSQKEKNIYYLPQLVILAPITIDYQEFPYTPYIIENDVNFWSLSNQTSNQEDFLKIIKAVNSASMEPIKQLNRDSISSKDRKIINQYVSVAEKFTDKDKYTEMDIPEILSSFKLNTPYDDRLYNLTWRYIGIQIIVELANKYQEILNENLENKLVYQFVDFLKIQLIRRYSIGLAKPTHSSFAKELLSSTVEYFRIFKNNLNSLDKADLNRAIIESDTKETAEKLSNTSFILDLNFKKYVNYWLEEFSGILPEEITLMLNTGAIFIVFDYQKMRIFSTFLTESSESNIDMGEVREYARKSIDNDKIIEKLILKAEN